MYITSQFILAVGLKKRERKSLLQKAIPHLENEVKQKNIWKMFWVVFWNTKSQVDCC